MNPRMYAEFADWWHILSAPDEYAEEAGIFADAIALNSPREVKTVLEIGSGGGNNASHMKERFELTLVDLSEGMLAASRKINPELEHIQGDMRDARLGRTFDAVFVHDAIAYMTNVEDLASAIETAAIHVEPGGIALLVPDETTETFEAETSHGGHDAGDRSIRYLQWTHPLEGTTCEVTYAFVLKEGTDIRVELDRHTVGVFPRATWLELIERAGLEPRTVPYVHSEVERDHEMFVGIKPR
jgi:SAM-dependent methyltransferase